MIKVGVIGAAGYAGVNLLSILLRHPEVKIVWISSEPAHNGKKISDFYPHLKGEIDLECQNLDIGKLVKSVDLIFLATPNGIAMNLVPEILASEKMAIDLSADYRFYDATTYNKWYKIKHSSPELLKDTVYGLPEIHKEKIKKAKLVGNPGCYPTAAILGLAPLIKSGLIDAKSIIVDAKSGVSGAGRGLSQGTHFPDCDEGVTPYNILTHRHTGEMEQELSNLAQTDIKIAFSPHLIPMTRGILATIYVKAVKTVKSVESVYKEFYKDAPFVRILEEEALPSTKFVYGTNFCDIGFRVDLEGKTIIVLSAIDNLIKGAAGEAVQNMNIMCGFDEKTSLSRIGIYP